ncbi:hypothetical protein Golax_008613, partial [Gossypium laxum]|nr:hypothetical protein [Gossypium laxum]
WNHSASYVRIPTALEDIRLLLDQRSEAQTPYEDLEIRAVIPDEFFQNLNISHVKVPLVNYATVRCTRRIECCSNLNFDNRFPWQLSRNILKYGKIYMIIYLLGNRSSFQS